MEPVSRGTRRAEYAGALAIVALATGLCLALRSRLATLDIAMLLLLGVVVVAARYPRGPAVVASLLSIALFDSLFVPPYYRFNVHDSAYYLSFGVMLLVALIMGGLTARIREHAETARERERQTAALYALDKALPAAQGIPQLLATISEHLGRAAGGEARILRAEELGGDAQLPEWPQTGVFESVAVRIAATWAWQHREPAGWSTPHGAEAEALLAPLVAPEGPLGLLVIRPFDADSVLSEEQRETVTALVGLAAKAWERKLLAERSEQARVDVAAERLRTALLSSLSHDLRTPLAGIEGSATSLLEDAGRLPPEVRRELLESILEESRRMTRLVTNLLDMIRVETGSLAVQKSWQPLEEPLGVALLRMEERLRAHPVTTRLPSDLPLVPVDELLLEQVFLNLLENAARYTPPGSPIEIAARPENGHVFVEIADRGPGVPPGEEEAVFERFHRGGTPSADAGAGSGLGLTICRGIVTAHGGRIWIEARTGGGARVCLTLPLEGPPVRMLPTEPAEF